MQSLAEMGKIFKYEKSTYLAKRGELVDYIGFLLSGRALMEIDNKIYGFLELGDIIGYMGAVNLPGNLAHVFDIVGEQEGFVLAVRLSELKLMSKLKPLLYTRMMNSLVLKAIRTVSHQFLATEEARPLLPADCKWPEKKVLDCMCRGELLALANALDKKDLRAVTACLTVSEFEDGHPVTQAGTVCKSLVLVLKGSIVSKDKKTVHSQGKILNILDFLHESTLEQGFDSQGKSSVGFLSEARLDELVRNHVSTYTNLVTALTSIATEAIKTLYHRKTGTPVLPFSLDIDLRDAGLINLDSDRTSGYRTISDQSFRRSECPISQVDLYDKIHKLLKDEQTMLIFKNIADEKERDRLIKEKDHKDKDKDHKDKDKDKEK